MAERRSYHHGNLRQALVEATAALIEEQGPQAFTLTEAARRAGVSFIVRQIGIFDDLTLHFSRNM